MFRFGVIFDGLENDMYTVTIKNIQRKYHLLQVLEFTSGKFFILYMGAELCIPSNITVKGKFISPKY